MRKQQTMSLNVIKNLFLVGDAESVLSSKLTTTTSVKVVDDFHLLTASNYFDELTAN